MAKKKSKPVEQEIVEEVIIEEVIFEEPIEEEVIEEVSEEITNEPIDEVAEDKPNQFIYTQLRMINKLSNPAKAKRLADRVLRNRKR